MSLPSLDQPICKFCGGPVPTGDRRPRQFCCDAHRQADYRKRHLDRAATEKAPITHPAEKNGSTTESTKTGTENPNKINGPNFVTSGPSVPLNVFGRAYRWPGAKANGNAVKISAAVDTELGAGAEWLTSSGGARYQVIPRRAR